MNNIFQRNQRLDFIRCLAIYFVINVHCLVAYDDAYLDEGLSSLQGLLANTIYYLKNAGVPLFVMLSGALLLGKKNSIGDFLKRRLSRVLIPFFIWSVVVYLFSSVKHQNPIEDLSIQDFLYRFFTNGVIGMYWFVYMIIGMYLITPIMQAAFENRGEKTELIVRYAAYIFLAIYLFGMFFPEMKIFWQFKSAQLVYFALFLWGYYIINYLQHKRYFKRYVIMVFMMFTLANIANIMLHYCNHFVFQHLWPLSFLTILLLVNVESLADRMKAIIVFISRASYGIYLCHFLVISGLMRIKIITPPIWAYPIFYPVLTLVICTVFFYVIDKTALRRYLM